MSTLKVFSSAGEAAEAMELSDDLLLLDQGDQAVKDVVTATLNARRAGTASTLGKGEVAGSNRKPWRQKGTGRARAGLRQSPVWRGGGVAMGPKPRDYGVKVNRKVARLAFRRALSDKIAGGELCVIERFELSEARTKLLSELLHRLLPDAKGGVLLVTAQPDETLARAARNISKVTVATATQVDVYLLLAHRTVVVTREGLELLTARLRRKAEVAA